MKSNLSVSYFTFKKNHLLCIVLAVIIAVGFSFSMPLVSDADVVADAAQVAADINSDAGTVVTATASGNTVNVVTKTVGNKAAPELIIEIPAGVTVEWGAEYINESLSDDLIYVEGEDETSVFRIVQGADIELKYGTGSEFAAVYADDAAVEMKEGYIYAGGSKALGIFSTENVTITHGVVDVSGSSSIGVVSETFITIGKEAGIFSKNADSADYKNIVDETKVDIAEYANNKITKITLDQSGTEKIELYDTVKLNASVAPTTGRTYNYFNWSSSDINVAKVDSSGNVSAVGIGTATITVKTTDGSNKTDKVTFRVSVSVTSIEISAPNDFPGTKIIKPGTKFQLTAKVLPVNATLQTIMWRDESIGRVATVDESGNVTALKEGDGRIRAATGPTASAKAAYFEFTVALPVTKVHTPVSNVVLKPNGTVKVPAFAYVGNAAKSAALKYSSSNDKVATVDSATGKIKAIKTGKAIITVKAYNGKSSKVTVNVVKKPKKISKLTIDSKSLPTSLKKGKSAHIKYNVTPASAAFSNPKFSTSNKKILTVDKTGKVTAKKKGTATITVKAGGKSAKKLVTVK